MTKLELIEKILTLITTQVLPLGATGVAVADTIITYFRQHPADPPTLTPADVLAKIGEADAIWAAIEQEASKPAVPPA